MNRSAALAVMLVAIGLFVLELLFRGAVWQWYWMPHPARSAVESGAGETVALVVALGAAFVWLRERYR